jgi:orotate phosphoribosyltransferase
MKCQCEGAGMCPLFNRRMTARDHSICCGTSGLSEAEAEAYRRKWGAPVEQKVAAAPKAATVGSTPRCSAGTQLAKMLTWFKAFKKGNCNCSTYAGLMDQNGCDWCEANIPTILGWIEEGAKQYFIGPFSLASVPGFNVTAEALVRSAIAKARLASKRPFEFSGEKPVFVSLEQFATDVKAFAGMIPIDAKGVVGIARSGLSPATIVAQLLHLPLKILRQHSKDGDYSLIDGGSGWRLSGNTGGQGPWVLIDDTVMSGNSFRYSTPTVRKELGDVMTAAMYVNPAAAIQPDIVLKEMPWPHLLEWNMFNSVMTPSMAFDFDGILCHDCPPGSDDDGPRYMEFLTNAPLRYPVRKVVISMIVTARLEKYRDVTRAWLARHGIAVDTLVMGPWKSLRERTFDKVCNFKAEHYAKFLKRRHHVKPPMFVESCPHQAKRIAELSGGLVVCPPSAQVF